MATKVRPKNLIGSVDKAINILRFLGSQNDGATLMAISNEFGWPHSTAHHILATLRYHGFVQQIPPGKRYHLGMSLFELGQRVLEHFSLVDLAMPHLRHLTEVTRETSNMGVLDGLDVIHIGQVPSEYIMKALTRVGGRAPAYCTGLGKSLLSGKTDDEIRNLYQDNNLVAHTPATLTSAEAIIEHLIDIRRRGYATDNQEREPNVCCVAAPIRTGDGTILAGVSVSGPASRLRTDDQMVIQAVMECAARVSDQLRYL